LTFPGILDIVSHFFTGKFLAQSGANDDADYFYLQSALKF